MRVFGLFDGGDTVALPLKLRQYRANILGDHYREVGFGVATARDYQGKADTSIVVDGTFSPVDGDEVLLRQVFANLIRNGVEATLDVGKRPTIHVSGEHDPARNVCRVYVDDNGPGIPVAAREKVFRPFFTTRSRGTGLGLAIVQKVMLTHDGKVSIADSPSGGARVQLVFPIAADRPVI